MLELKNLSYKPEGKPVLNGIDFRFKENRTYVLTGQNGSGKSSMIRIIAGFNRQTGGSVLYRDNPVDNWTVTRRAESFMACSFQIPVLFKGVTVEELLDISLKNGNSPMNKSELLYRVGLDPLAYMGRSMDETLSGGELKRIEIASVLARNTPLIILDEPEAGIDLWSFKRLTETIEKMKREQGTTFILISHQERLMSIADEIICMKDGGIERVQSGQDFLNSLKELESHVR